MEEGYVINNTYTAYGSTNVVISDLTYFNVPEEPHLNLTISAFAVFWTPTITAEKNNK